jgi:hypothetical protein
MSQERRVRVVKQMGGGVGWANGDRCYIHTPQTVGVSHELELSCDYDIISSGHFHHLPYDVYVMSVLLIPTTETISISGVIASYMTHPSIMTQ